MDKVTSKKKENQGNVGDALEGASTRKEKEQSRTETKSEK